MLFLAIRHLLSKKRQTVLTLLGIVLGTTAFVAITGMMLGFQSFIIDQLVNNDAHIRISAREEFITEHSLDTYFFGENALVSWKRPPAGRRDNPYILYPRGWIERLSQSNEVEAFSPQIVVQAIAAVGKASSPVRVIGTQPERQIRVTNIQKYMVKGEFSKIGTSGNRIVAGDGLLRKLGLSLYDHLLLSTGSGKRLPFTIVGVFHLGIKALDESMVFGSLVDVQRLNGTPSRITDIAVRLSSVESAKEIADSWNSLSQEKVQSWDQANEGIMSVFQTQDIVRATMTFSILLVAGFGIYNILNMAVTNKRREIAILRSMGYQSRDIQVLFLIQGIILGAIGGLLGCLLGWIACKIMGTITVSSNRGLGDDHMMIVYYPSI